MLSSLIAHASWFFVGGVSVGFLASVYLLRTRTKFPNSATLETLSITEVLEKIKRCSSVTTPVALTAMPYAMARSIESSKSDGRTGLIDPFSTKFAEENNPELWRKFLEMHTDCLNSALPLWIQLFFKLDVPFLAQSMVSRYIVNNHQLKQAFKVASVEQLVILASGLDTRTFQLSHEMRLEGIEHLISHVTVWEIDFKDVVGLREHFFAKQAWQHSFKQRVPVSSDASDAERLMTDLEAAGFDPSKPAAVVAEGLFGYMAIDTVQAVWTRLSQRLAPGSLLLVNLPNVAMAHPNAKETQLYRLLGGCLQCGVDDPWALLRACGWQAESVMDSVEMLRACGFIGMLRYLVLRLVKGGLRARIASKSPSAWVAMARKASEPKCSSRTRDAE